MEKNAKWDNANQRHLDNGIQYAYDYLNRITHNGSQRAVRVFPSGSYFSDVTVGSNKTIKDKLAELPNQEQRDMFLQGYLLVANSIVAALRENEAHLIKDDAE